MSQTASSRTKFKIRGATSVKSSKSGILETMLSNNNKQGSLVVSTIVDPLVAPASAATITTTTTTSRGRSYYTNPFRVFKTWVKHFTANLSAINSRLKTITDEVISSDEVVEELFGEHDSDEDSLNGYEQDNAIDDVYLDNGSIDDDDSEDDFDSSSIFSTQGPTQIVQARLHELPRTVTKQFKDYDATVIVQNHIKETPETPFSNGEDFWEKRRQLWLQGAVHLTPSSSPQLSHSPPAKNLQHVAKTSSGSNPDSPKLVAPALLSSTSSNNSIPTTPHDSKTALSSTKVISNLTPTLPKEYTVVATTDAAVATDSQLEDISSSLRASKATSKQKKIEVILTEPQIRQVVRKRYSQTSLSKCGISKDNYCLVYENLVLQNKKLRRGKRINLRDLINVIYTGWTESRVDAITTAGRISSLWKILKSRGK